MTDHSDRHYLNERQPLIGNHGVPDYLPGFAYDFLLPLYDPVQHLLGVGAHHRALIDQANLQSSQRVLEIGCGTGNLMMLIKRLYPNVDVVGLDPDPKALVRAQRKADREGLPIGLERGFAQTLPYPDGSFDRVFSAFMLHHLNHGDKEKTLREARRVLKLDGSLHLVDFGGATGSNDGFFARLLRHSERLGDNVDDRIPELMRHAGFTAPAEMSHRVTAIGRITCYRAEVPH